MHSRMNVAILLGCAGALPPSLGAIIEGVNLQAYTPPGATILTADLPIVAQGAPLGFYTVLTEQEDCVGQTLVGDPEVPGSGFEVVCSNPSVFTGVEPSMLETPQGTVEFRVSGTDLVDAGQSELDSVSLVIGNTVLTDDSPTPAGEDLLITLDLSSAPAGYYTLKGTRPDDQCPDPDDVSQAFELVSPCDNLLFNGDFELGPGKDVNGDFIRADLPPADGWTQVEGTGEPRYNEFAQGPPDFIPGNAEDDCPEGDNYGSVHTDNGNVSRMIQVVDRPLDIHAGMELGLRGWIWGCSADPTNRNFYHRARLWDGTDTDPGTGTVLAEFVMAEEDHCAGLWVPFSVIGAPTSGSVVTVEWGYERGLSGEWAIPATHVDDLKLCPPISCNDPFADFDGDEDVDQDDFGVMQKCIAGIGYGILPGCDCADADHDGDVTEPDHNAFEACASGPDVDADITCDDP